MYFPKNRVRYIALLDNYDSEDESSRNDWLPFKSVLNDMYAKDISNKIKATKHFKMDKGLFIGGKAPYGYVLSKEKKNCIIIDEEAANIVKRIFNMAARGVSCRAIAQELSLENIPSPSKYALSKGCKISNVSKHWAGERIREILLNEVYIGNMVQGRMKKVTYKSKKNIRLPRDKWVVVKNTHEPIIDTDTFRKAGAMIETRKQTRVKTHDFLLKGLARCHECGRKMGCSPMNLAEGKVYYFRCATYTSYARLGKCTSHNIRMDIVESAVIEKVNEVCKKYIDKSKLPDVARKELRIKKQSNNYIKQLEILKNKVGSLSISIDRIYNDKLEGVLLEDDFVRIYNKKKEEKENLQQKIFQIQSYLESNIENEDVIIDKIIQKFLELEKPTKEIIHDLVEKVDITDKKEILVFFKFKSLS